MYEDLAKLVRDRLSLSSSADQRNANKVTFGLFITVDIFDGSFFFEFLNYKITRNFVLYDPFDLLQWGKFPIFEVDLKQKQEQVVELGVILGQVVVEAYDPKSVVGSWFFLQLVDDAGEGSQAFDW